MDISVFCCLCVKELCCLSPIITLYPFHYQLENTEQMALHLPLMFMHMKFLSFWSHIYYLCLWQAIESQPKGSLAYLLCFQHQLLPPLENRTGSTEPGNETLNFYPDMKVAHTDRWVFNQFT